jgi:DNA anti-recombination protein RmuC
LLEQARALRDRIGQQLGRVKEWVRERFPEPFQQIKDRARDLFGTAPERSPAVASQEAVPLDLAALKAKGRAMSDGWRQTLHQRQAEERRAEGVRQEQERQRQVEAERVQRERQALADRQAREQAERQRTVEQFRQLAAKREMKGVGYGDRSEDWRATPEALRERIDRFNALVPEARQKVLERLVQEPARGRGLDELQQLMDQRRELVKALGRGMGR